MKKVWKIVTNLTNGKNAKIDAGLSPEDDVFLISLDITSVDELDDNGFITSYAISTEESIFRLKSLLYEYEIEFNIKDITKDFLIGRESPKVTDTDDFKNFIVENLTPDIVLDKINEMGIDSLSDTDRLVLENI